MTPAGTNLLLAHADAAADDVVTKSLRFGGDGYLDRASIGTPTDATKFTASLWLKRNALGGDDNIIAGGTSGTDWSLFRGITSVDKLFFDDFTNGSTNYAWRWSPVLRDVASWYHLLLVWDASQTATTDKMKLYINGSEVTSDYTLNTPATDHQISITKSGMTQWFGRNATGGSANHQIADAYLIDGQALTPTSFAEEDETTGQWKPKEYSGSGYGTNGFHLDFKDADDIGNDVSGNDNDFSDTNLATSDVLADTPTDNYCVYNAVFSGATGLSEGNLKCTTTARGTFDAMSFASYWEIEANTTSVVGGVISEGGTANTVSVTNGSTFGFRLSAAGALEYTTNGSSWSSIGGTLSGEQFPYVTGGTTTANFGQSTLSYSVPSGYAVLSTGNFPTPTIKKGVTYFDTKLYDDGTGAKTFDNGTVSMQPDLVWAKSRGSSNDHKLTDSVREEQNSLESNTTDTEVAESSNVGVMSFDADGFTIGSSSSTTGPYADQTGDGMVAWNWKKSAIAGFNIVDWTGDALDYGTETQELTHSLGVAPEMIILKGRTDNAGMSGGWYVYHKDLSSSSYLLLNSTDGEAPAMADVITNIGTSTVDVGTDDSSLYFNYGGDDFGTSADTYIGYFFASVAGYSKVGSFSGSSTVFIYTGFRPAFILAKRYDMTGGNWLMFDDKREGYNVDNDDLMANSSAVEATTDHIDILSNGFKIRTSDADLNGGTVIYLAVAKNPFKYASAR